MYSYPCLNLKLFIPSAYLKLRIFSRMSKVAHNELRISFKIFWTLILRSDMSDVVTKVKIWRVEKREGEYKRSLGGWDENVKAATPMKGPWFSVHVTASSETAYNFYIDILLYFTNHSKSPILIPRTTTCSWFPVALFCAKYSTFNQLKPYTKTYWWKVIWPWGMKESTKYWICIYFTSGTAPRSEVVRVWDGLVWREGEKGEGGYPGHCSSPLAPDPTCWG